MPLLPKYYGKLDSLHSNAICCLWMAPLDSLSSNPKQNHRLSLIQHKLAMAIIAIATIDFP